MGVIKDGTVTGFLPEAEVFVVHYPGYPSSTARAIETLGGVEEISTRRSSKGKYIDLRFRPEDPYSHPTFGDLRTSNNLMLRISKKKNGSSPSNVSECLGEAQLCADVVAKVSEAYHFEGMADYQYVLPVHAAKSKKKRKCSVEKEPNFEKGDLMDFEHDDLMMLVPPLFSLKDIPEEIVLKAPSSLVPKQLQKGVVEQWWETDIEPCLALPFAIKKIPEKICWEDKIPKNSHEWQCQMVVSRLFDERPIWPRRSLVERLVDDGHKFPDNQLRRLFYRSGYYFATGPFGKFWIRKGYDPRTDPGSLIYQKVDFRIPGPIRKFAKNRSSPRWRDQCQFQAIPSKIFTCFQFYELDDEYIQQEIRKPADKKTCTHSTGWLRRSMLEILRLHVRLKFLLIFDNAVTTNLVKSTKKQLEKIKTLLLYGEPDADEEDDPCINRSKILIDDEPDPDEEDPSLGQESVHPAFEVGGMKSCNLQPVRDSGEEPHEVEDEEDEEELDEYELPSMGGGNDGFSLDGSCDMKENVSSDYLQEILSGFHSGDGDNYQSNDVLHSVGTSDDEYQIYEQDTDNDDYLDDY